MNAIVLLVDRVHARIFYFVGGKLSEEVVFLEKDMPPRVKAASWFALRDDKVARHIAEHVKAHYKNVLGKLEQFSGTHPAEALIVGGPKEALAAFLPTLGSRFGGKLAGTWQTSLKVDLKEILERTKKHLDAFRHNQEAKILAELEDSLKRRGRGARGLEETLESLNLGEVRRLFLDSRFKARGFRCRRDGYLASYNHSCPRCGRGTTPAEDLRSAILIAAEGTGAEVFEFHVAGALGKYGGIAAILRYK